MNVRMHIAAIALVSTGITFAPASTMAREERTCAIDQVVFGPTAVTGDWNGDGPWEIRSGTARARTETVCGSEVISVELGLSSRYEITPQPDGQSGKIQGRAGLSYREGGVNDATVARGRLTGRAVYLSTVNGGVWKVRAKFHGRGTDGTRIIAILIGMLVPYVEQQNAVVMLSDILVTS